MRSRHWTGRVVLLLSGLAVGLVLATSHGPAAAQDTERRELVRGRLQFEAKPVGGVELSARLDGRVVGRAVSGPDGDWEIILPGPGFYEVELEVDSLPADVGLTDPDRHTLQVTVRPRQQRTLLFPLGEREALGALLGRRLAQAMVNGTKFGLMIAMMAIGLSLVFGTTRLVNFAHGDMVTFGAAVALYLNAARPRIHLVPAALVAVAVGGAFGGALERGLWRPLRARRTGMIQLLVISIGLSLLIRHLVLLQMGGRPRPYRQYSVQTALRLGPVGITPRDLVVILLSALVLTGVGLMLLRTRLGKAMRAVADNRDLAESSGIDVQRVILYVWVMAGSLAALGGVFLGVVESVEWTMGFRALLLMFAAVILGGLGSAFGAMAGGITVGIVTETSAIFQPVELKFMWALVALVVVLLIRPQGIFGRRERIG